MRAGSKVVCIENDGIDNPEWPGKVPTIGETYIVRSLWEKSYLADKYCTLEELPHTNSGGGSIFYYQKWFRDIDEIGGTADEILQKAVLGEDEVSIGQLEEQELTTA